MKGKDKFADTHYKLKASNFDMDAYSFPSIEGTVVGTLKAKLWGNGKNIIGYYELLDGRKIKASTWQKDKYLAINTVPVGSLVMLTFEKDRRRCTSLCAIQLLSHQLLGPCSESA